MKLNFLKISLAAILIGAVAFLSLNLDSVTE